MGGLLGRLFGHAPRDDPEAERAAAELDVLADRASAERARAMRAIRAWDREEGDIRRSSVAGTLLAARDRGREWEK